MLLILNSVPVTFVTYSEFTRPSVPVITHSLYQKLVARKCVAKIAGDVQAKIKRQHRLVNSFSVIPPASQEHSQRYTKKCVTSPHHSAGDLPNTPPNDTFTQSEYRPKDLGIL